MRFFIYFILYPQYIQLFIVRSTPYIMSILYFFFSHTAANYLPEIMALLRTAMCFIHDNTRQHTRIIRLV